MNIEQQVWGFTPEGEAVILYTMTNNRGASVKLTNIGATVVSVIVPDRQGKMADVALGYKSFESYLHDGANMGKIVGRYGNRIANGRFTLDGKEYILACNNGKNHLHGGPRGWATKLWASRVETDRVVFSIVSPDGDENYPGEVTSEVVYDWNDDCELEITLFARTSAPTVINLTNHAYFNLKGEGNGDIHDLTLQLHADYYLPTDEGQIPTGEMTPVKDTPMDFTQSKALGKDIEADFEPLKIGSGYDHCWVVRDWSKGHWADVGTLVDPQSGRRMTIRSTQPGVQVYTGNHLQGSPLSKQDQRYVARSGVAIECQGFPDAPNQPQFPTTTLRPEEIFKESILFKFDTI